MASWNGYTPKGFRKSFWAPKPPITGKGEECCYNGPFREPNAVKAGGDSWYGQVGWLGYHRFPYSGVAGAKFTIDLAAWAGSASYFNLTKQQLKVQIRFHSILTGWDEDFHDLSGWFDLQRGDNPGKLTFSYSEPVAPNYTYATDSVQYKLWHSPGTFSTGGYKPPYGIILCYNPDGSLKVDPRDYGDYADYCKAMDEAGAKRVVWETTYNDSYLGKMPNGVRYLSNDGKWGYNKPYPDASGWVYKSYQGISSATGGWNISNLDGDSNSDGYKSFTITKEMIENMRGGPGKAVGVTEFELRFVETIHGIGHWFFGGRYGDSLYTQIDNPLLGLLDWGDKGAPYEWPERYDAKAIVGSKNNYEELQAQYADAGGNWHIF